MKKRSITVFAAVAMSLMLMLCMSACGSSSEEAQEETAAEETTVAEEDYTEYGNKAQNNAMELVGLIDPADVQQMLDENTEHCDGAKNIEKAIDAYMKDHPDITYAYVIRYKDDSKEAAEFLVNWEDTDEYWGEDFELYDEAITALNGEPVCDKEPTTDEDGTVITGYAPYWIEDSVPIVVCVDYAGK